MEKELQLPADLEQAISRGDTDNAAKLLQNYNPMWRWAVCYATAVQLCGGSGDQA